MAHGFSFKFNKRRKRGGKKAKYRQQMLSTNTVTKIASKVARLEAAKNRISLVKRNYLFPEALGIPVYTPTTNVFSNGLPCDWLGYRVRMMRVPLQDVDMVVNAPEFDDPLTQDNEFLDGDGLAQGQITKSQHGRRTGNVIKLSGIGINIRLRLPPGTGMTTHSPDPKLFGKVEFKWAVVLWRSNQMANPLIHPEVHELLEYRPWGYTPKLDIDLSRFHKDVKIRTLMSGKTTLRQTDSNQVDRYISRFLRLKDPIEIKYQVGDQNGTASESWRCYFVCRSNVPASDADYDSVRPQVVACSKCFYYEP